MTPQFGGPQFQLANVIRALGQPFTIVPLSAIATAALAREQQGDGSALFNIARNLGGSVGTALLSTMITQREQFHDFRIGERVTIYSLEVQRFINSQVAQFERQGGDPVLAMRRVYKTLQSAVQLSSFVMAFSECFLVVGIVLLAGSMTIWLCRKTKSAGEAPAG
jgi:MFS transporter, DHA2 family, multidrug resistance protein